MKTGRVKFFNEEKGYGFIAGEDKTDYFVHQTDIINMSGFRKLAEGQEVSFETEEAARGPKAVSVAVLG